MGPVKFKHFRMFDENGKVSPCDGLTIAWVEDPEGCVIFGSSKCHPSDNFVKKLGRIKSYGRLKSKKALVTDMNESDFLRAMAANWEEYLHNTKNG